MLGDAYYGCYDEPDWPDQPRGKYKGKAGLQKRVCKSLLIITASRIRAKLLANTTGQLGMF